MPILVLGRLIFGVTLVWSYIHQQARFLSPAGGAPGQWCKIKVPEKSPNKSLLKTVLYMKFCVKTVESLRLCAFLLLCVYAFSHSGPM